MKRFLFFAGLLCCGYNSNAQRPNEWEVQCAMDFVSQSIWRGSYQAGASIQPEAEVSLKDWSFSVWGTTGLRGTNKEIDITLSYTRGQFTVGLTDYWFGEAADSYLTGHIPEVNLLYTLESIPLELSLNTVIANDNKRLSSYTEAVYSPSFKDVRLEFTIGVTPWGNNMLMTDGIAVTQLSAGALRAVPVSKTFGIELSMRLICNPYEKAAYWVAGVSLPFRP
jgi:hypothetical protein